MIPEGDRLFAQYQQDGDPATLAAVFDLTAPKLLLLAIHLAGDDLGAEDLVQTTFLKIIENAQSYDSSRPFLPWASTILGNEARQVWHKRQREAANAQTERGVPSDPLQVAADADTVEVLTGAIDQLEENYRAVVRLKVVHGMKPGEIAQVLSIQPELARTRLSRGLKLLREALPAGIAGSALLLMNGRGLAQARNSVIEEARRVHAERAAGLSASPLLWFGALFTLLAGLGGWWLLDDLQERDSSEHPHALELAIMGEGQRLPQQDSAN